MFLVLLFKKVIGLFDESHGTLAIGCLVLPIKFHVFQGGQFEWAECELLKDVQIFFIRYKINFELLFDVINEKHLGVVFDFFVVGFVGIEGKGVF